MAAYTASGTHATSSLINGIFGALLSQAFTQKAFVATAETTTVATGAYVNLATVGPTVTITSTGSFALVFISSFITASAVHNAQASVAISGATTQSALTTASNGLLALSANANQIISASMDIIAITPGTNTYTMQYTNSGAQTGTFADRKLIVIAP